MTQPRNSPAKMLVRGAVSAVRFSPDGSQIASGSHDQTIKIWDSRSGKEIHTLIGHADDVRGLDFSPDGSRIASCSSTVKLWKLENGQEVLTLDKHKGAVTCIRFSEDGSKICSSSRDNTINIYDGRDSMSNTVKKGVP